MSGVPYPIKWKHDFLDLEKQIKEFRAKYRTDDTSVTRLLHYHLSRSSELLYAEVNGGLDEEYQEEADKTPPAHPI